MPERPEFKANFGEKAPDEEYLINANQKFVSGIRKHYPNSKIICALGNMDATREGSKWPDYIEQAVTNLNTPAIYTRYVPYKGTPGNPSVKEQEQMADSFIRFVDENILW
jgi:hypothetical protein